MSTSLPAGLSAEGMAGSRKSFIKDAARLPAPFQHQLVEIIENIEQAYSPRQLVNCKKIKGHKSAYRIRMGTYRVGFTTRNRASNWSEFWIEMRSTDTFRRIR